MTDHVHGNDNLGHGNGNSFSNSGDVSFTLQVDDGYRPFALCETNVLVDELAHRENLRSQESAGRRKNIISWIALVAMSITGACIYLAFIYEIPTEIVVGLSIAGFLFALVQIIDGNRPSAFELRQIGAIQEIRDILRERG